MRSSTAGLNRLSLFFPFFNLKIRSSWSYVISVFRINLFPIGSTAQSDLPNAYTETAFPGLKFLRKISRGSYCRDRLQSIWLCAGLWQIKLAKSVIPFLVTLVRRTMFPISVHSRLHICSIHCSTRKSTRDQIQLILSTSTLLDGVEWKVVSGFDHMFWSLSTRSRLDFYSNSIRFLQFSWNSIVFSKSY